MNWLVISSGILGLITSAAHIVAGGKDVARPLLASTLNDDVKLTTYACWHLVSVSLVASSLALIIEGLGLIKSPSMVIFISALWLIYGIVFLVVTLGVAKPPGIVRFPQWTLLLPVGLLGLLGIVLR